LVDPRDSTPDSDPIGAYGFREGFAGLDIVDNKGEGTGSQRDFSEQNIFSNMGWLT